MGNTEELEAIKYRLDAIQAAQLAAGAVLGVLLQRHRGDPEVIASLQSAFDRTQSAALASLSTDYSLNALAELAESYLQAVKPPG